MTMTRRSFQAIGTWTRPDVFALPTTRSTDPKPENVYFVARIIKLLLGSNILITLDTILLQLNYGGCERMNHRIMKVVVRCESV